MAVNTGETKKSINNIRNGARNKYPVPFFLQKAFAFLVKSDLFKFVFIILWFISIFSLLTALTSTHNFTSYIDY